MNRISDIRKTLQEKVALLIQKRGARIASFRRKLEQAKIEQIRRSIIEG